MPQFKPNLFRSEMQSPLGTITLAADGDALVGIWFEGQQHWPRALDTWTPVKHHAVIDKAASQLREYFAGTRQHFDLPLDLSSGTAFQQSVWRRLLAIPTGETVTYGSVGQHIGKPGAVRAVGRGRRPQSVPASSFRATG